MRKIIEYPKIEDYYSSSNEFSKTDALVHLEVKNFNLVTGLILISSASILLSLIEISFAIVPVTVFSFLLFEYFQLRNYCTKLEVERTIMGHHFTEGDRLKVRYVLNYIPYDKFTLFEHFEGVSLSEQMFNLQDKETKVIEKSYHLNQGFGEFEFRHLKAIVSDTFGFFTFKIDFLQNEKIQIYPRVQAIKLEELISSTDAKSIGEYEYIKRGLSPIFYGLREYRYGDPCKFINWKATQKAKKVLINEYENIQSLEAVIYIDLNSSNHYGNGINSTWEYCRDLALSIAQVHSDHNHLLQMMSHDYISENTQASITFEEMRHYLHFCTKTFKVDSRPVAESLMLMDYGCSLSMILPLGLNDEVVSLVHELKRTSSNFSQIDIYFVDAFEVVKESVAAEFKPRVMAEQKNAFDFLENMKQSLLDRGIRIHLCQVVEPHEISTQLRKIS